MTPDIPRRPDAVSEGATRTDPSGVIPFWADRAPQLTALRCGASFLTYGELEARISLLARSLVESGAGPGHRVAVVGENEIDAVVAILAAWRSGACAVPLNARYTEREIRAILDHADPRLVIATGGALFRHAGIWSTCSNGCPSKGIFEYPEATADPVEPESAERVVLMLYTSGTTGAPKGVMLPARALTFMAGLWAHRPVVAGDRIYQALPISHSYGLCSYLFGALNLGCEVELTSRFEPEALRIAFANGLALFQGVPAMYSRYLQHLQELGLEHAAPALKAISTGGAPLDPDLKRRVEAVFGLSLRQAFGLTEAGPTVTIPDGAPQDATAVGRPAPGAEVRLVDPATGQAAKGSGELWVRSPGVMKGYFRAPGATAEVLTKEGWLRTGDIARIAADGVLHIVGRQKDVIIRSGFNVYPAEIESVLLSHPAVVQAAVVGRPSVEGDEDVVAFVELAADNVLGPDELMEYAAKALVGYKRPSELHVLDRLPMGLSGKIATGELKSLALNLRGPETTEAR